MAEIKLAIVIEASAEKIYPLVATARGLSQWWAADVTESGGTVDLGFFQSRDGLSVEADTGRRAARSGMALPDGSGMGRHTAFL
ncbi:MAG TPA: hypothetical protein VHM88_24220 [Candidatus Acidoferrales bacterium]|nr:hypothetical protein [Candidatus Acidoferrales bacterium]